MNTLKIVTGLIALAIAWLFMFRAGFVFNINAWIRENVFNDQWILFAGRRVAVLLILLGIVALFSGIEGLNTVQTIKPQIAAAILAQAQADFHQGHYRPVVRRCQLLVRSDPQNVEALELMASALWALGEKKYAMQIRDTLLRVKPDDPLGSLIPSAKKTPAP